MANINKIDDGNDGGKGETCSLSVQARTGVSTMEIGTDVLQVRTSCDPAFI